MQSARSAGFFPQEKAYWDTFRHMTPTVLLLQTTVDAARKANQSLDMDFVASVEEFLFLDGFLNDHVARDSHHQED
jgi:hypothetical protein